MVWKVLSQVCLAYRCDGGRVVVVLSSRDKLVRFVGGWSHLSCLSWPFTSKGCQVSSAKGMHAHLHANMSQEIGCLDGRSTVPS